MRDWSEVKAICEKATPGPWELAGCNGELTGINGPSGYDHEMGIMPGQLEVYGGDDAIFISVARTALPEAIAEIEQLRQEKAELVKALKKAKDIIDEVQSNDGALEIHGWHLNGDPVSYEALILDNIPEDDVAEIERLLAKFEGGEPNE